MPEGVIESPRTVSTGCLMWVVGTKARSPAVTGSSLITSNLAQECFSCFSMTSLLGDSDGGWRESGDTNSLCPQGTHRCIQNPEDSRQCLWIDSHKGHHTHKCQTGQTFQPFMPDPSHSTDIIHQAGKILGTRYKGLERNGKILPSGVL